MKEIRRIKTTARLSQAVQYGRTVYLSGQVADNRALDVQGQTGEVLAKIDGLLAQAATDKTTLLTATVWLANMQDYDQMNAVWDAWIAGVAAPARACVESRLARPDIKVEIQVVAVLPETGSGVPEHN